MITVCIDCESPHFNVRWNDETHLWNMACEGCGCVYELLPSGTVQSVSKGIEITDRDLTIE